MLGGKKRNTYVVYFGRLIFADVSHVKRIREKLAKLTAQGILMERFQAVWTSPLPMHGAYASSDDHAHTYAMRMLRQAPPEPQSIEEKRVRFDKAEIRKKWGVVSKRVQSIVFNQTTAKPSLREAIDTLQSVADLIHLPNDIYTGDGFFQELFASIDVLLIHVIDAREWVSKVLDELHPDPLGKSKSTTLPQLRRLLSEGHQLFLR